MNLQLEIIVQNKSVFNEIEFSTKSNKRGTMQRFVKISIEKRSEINGT